ncbi:MAG TPA: lysophospholipid acyltransferase family protein [Aggregatilinea sp.]|uniref:lysophospholipid acyltransferase family protein n=1 Tax=Aggregatilinea sp. TaxID=2806333 RepID=UPI002BE3FF39|nr:lysophospholipid acyltransferase family protein [Aggregatilinea sp.]HML22614.1 lysophospholipid acyltransferase family protein [Aggregatilinea sp.]
MTSQASPHSHAYDIVYHQDRYDRRRGFLRDFVLRKIGFGLLVKMHIEGTEHIPASGPAIVIMNHIGAIDPFVVTGAITSRYIVPMSKAENYDSLVAGFMARAWGAYPVKRGEVDRRALDSTIELLRRERMVLIAPEGTRQRALSEAKDGMTYIATKTNAVILPVGVEGTNQFPATLKKLRRTPVTVRFGPAFRFRTDGRTRIPREELAAMTHEAMSQIAALLPEHLRGAYRESAQAPASHLEFIDEPPQPL